MRPPSKCLHFNAAYYVGSLLPMLVDDCKQLLPSGFVFQQDGSSSSHGPSDAGMVEGELHRLRHKRSMATKLTRPQPTRLSCVRCDASSISQTSVKAKDHPELKSALQQIWNDLPQTTINKAINDFRERLNACVLADGGHFEHMM